MVHYHMFVITNGREGSGLNQLNQLTADSVYYCMFSAIDLPCHSCVDLQ